MTLDLATICHDTKPTHRYKCKVTPTSMFSQFLRSSENWKDASQFHDGWKVLEVIEMIANTSGLVWCQSGGWRSWFISVRIGGSLYAYFAPTILIIPTQKERIFLIGLERQFLKSQVWKWSKQVTQPVFQLYLQHAYTTFISEYHSQLVLSELWQLRKNNRVLILTGGPDKL